MTDLSTAGDNDRWMILERQSDEGLPLIVRSRVNNPEIAKFEDQNKVSAIILDLRPEHVRDDGFPRELEPLHQLEDQIVGKLDALNEQCFHTASVTGDARRVFYVAHSKNAPIEDLVNSIDVEFGELQLFNDFETDVYREFVTPSALDRQLDGDQGVIGALEQNGDQGHFERKIDFWFYGDRAQLEHLLAELQGIGFTLDHWLDEPNGMVASKEAPATMAHFRELTPTLIDLANQHAIDYDGWETFIVTGNEAVTQAVVEPKPTSLFKKLFGQKTD